VPALPGRCGQEVVVAEESKGSGLRPVHGVAVVVVAVFGVILAFWVLSFIAGLVWGIVKLAVIVLVVLGLLWLIVGRRR
jgi:hypothetical protein